MSADQLLAVGLDGEAYYVTWGPIQISAANLVMIALTLILFVLAIVLTFPKSRSRP